MSLGYLSIFICFSGCWSTCSFFFLPSLLRTCEDESTFIPKHVFASVLALTASEDPLPQQHPTAAAAGLAAAAAAKGNQNIQPVCSLCGYCRSQGLSIEAESPQLLWGMGHEQNESVSVSAPESVQPDQGNQATQWKKNASSHLQIADRDTAK